MTSSDVPRAASARAPRASAIERAGALETAPYVPDLHARAPRRTAMEAPAAAPPVLLVDDGCAPGVRSAVEAGMAAALAGGRHLLALYTARADDAAALRALLLGHRPSGAVLMPALAERTDLAAAFAATRVPCIQLGPSGEFAFDERRAAASVVGWLASLGHVRIGLVAGPEASESARQRELGYLDAMAERGLDRGPALIVPGDDSFESGIAAGRLLLEISPRPTAILACSDEMAAGVLHAASAAGVAVPEALSVVGFDDTPLARRTLPPLTSVHLPWEQAGRDAALRIVNADAAPAAHGNADIVLAERNSVRRLE